MTAIHTRIEKKNIRNRLVVRDLITSLCKIMLRVSRRRERDQKYGDRDLGIIWGVKVPHRIV